MSFLNKNNHPKEEPDIDYRVFRTVSHSTLEHLSQFCGSVPDMAKFIAEKYAEIETIEQLTASSTAPLANEDNIHIGPDGELTLLK